MKSIRLSALVTIAIYFSTSSFGQGDAATDKSFYETKLVESINQHTGSQTLTNLVTTLSTEGARTLLNGTANCFGQTNVPISASFSNNNLVQFTASLPAKTMNWKNVPLISKVYPDKGTLKLPDVIRDNLTLGKLIIGFGEDGTTMNKVNISLDYNTSWTILEKTNLKLDGITVAIEVDPSSPSNATGSLSGNFSMTGTSGIPISASLSKNINDWKISAAINNLSLEELLGNFYITQPLNHSTIFSTMMGMIGSTNLSIDLYPFSRKISFNASNNIVTLNIQAERLEAADVAASTSTTTTRGYGLIAGLAFNDFKFSSQTLSEPWRGMLSFLDNIKSKTGIYLSTFEGQPDNILPVFEELGFEGPVYKGVTFITGINLSEGFEDLKKMLRSNGFKSLVLDPAKIPLQNITVQANLPLNPSELKVEGAIGFKESMNLGQVIWLRDIKLILEANAGSPKFSLASTISLKVEPNKVLDFYFKGSGEPTSFTVSGSGAMTNYWNNPYGFPFRIGKLLFGAGLNFTDLIPVLDNTVMSGEMEFGGASAEGSLGFDINVLSNNFVQAKLKDVNFQQLTEYFCGPAIKDKIMKAPYLGALLKNSKLDTAEVRLAPATFSLMSYGVAKTITQGFEINAAGRIINWNGAFKFRLDGPDAGMNMGLSAHGFMDPITAKLDGLTLVDIRAANGKEKAEMFIDLTAKHIIQGIASSFVSAAGVPNTPDRFAFVNASINILDVVSNAVYMDFTNRGFNCQVNGKIYGFLTGTLDAELDISKIETSYVRASVDKGFVWSSVQNELKKVVNANGFGLDVWNELAKRTITIESMKFEGPLNVLRKNATVALVFRIGSETKTVNVTIPVSTAANFFKAVAVDMGNQIKGICTSIYNGITQAAIDAKNGLVRTATSASGQAAGIINEAMKSVPDQATVINKASEIASGIATQANAIRQKALSFSRDFAGFTSNIITSIYNKTKDQLINRGSKAFDAIKQFFTGSDNEELIIFDGPGYNIYVKATGQILKGTASRTKNQAISMAPRSANHRAEEIWMLYPNDTEGSFFITNSFNGLIIAKPWPTHLILIPHESDHKKRERMLMEAVPDDPGYYYLKYLSDNNYAEVKNVAVSGVNQWVLAPVATRPGDHGKFRFDKAADISWESSKFPPGIIPAVVYNENSFYVFGGEPEVYKYHNGQFRWVPDMEMFNLLKLSAANRVSLPVNAKVGAIFGNPLPSGKNGSLLKEFNGDGRVYIMENGTRRWIPDAETFNIMRFRGEMVQSISRTDILKIPEGKAIPSKLQPSINFVEKALYRSAGDPTVYIFQNNSLRGIPDPETLTFMGYNFSQVNSVQPEVLNRYTKGTTLVSRRTGTLLRSSTLPDVYVMENGLRRAIPDEETFNALGYDWNKIVTVQPAEVEAIPRSADLGSKKQ